MIGTGLRGAFATVACCSAAMAQREWIAVRQPTGELQIAFDGARERLVAFGGNYDLDMNRTYEWDAGHGWQQRLPAGSPSPRGGHAMAYDSARRRVLLFGGVDTIRRGPLLGDTWEWDGDIWTERFPAVSPSARSHPGMGFDPQRQRMVLFGGVDATGYLGDTFEWDGTNWRGVATTVAPSPRSHAAMAFDPVSRRMLLFGGDPGISTGGATWFWDGLRWTRQPAVGVVTQHGTAWLDERRQRVSYADSGASVWEWDGRNWNQRPSGPIRSASYGCIAFDSVVGRATLSTDTGELWQLFPTGWKQVASQWSPYIYPAELATDYTTGRVISFGREIGLGVDFATHGFDGRRWNQLQHSSPFTPPSDEPRCSDTMVASDPLRQRVVVFGGLDARQHDSSGTWEWNGTSWHAVGIVPPPARHSGRMAFAPLNAGVLLFGGTVYVGTSFAQFDDTWLFDGSSWLQLHPAAHPSARGGHAMATDMQRARIVMFGGESAAGLEADTWEWNGSDWQLRAPASASGPSPRRNAAMTAGLGSGRIVMHGGWNENDTWEWNGSSWARLLVASPPPLLSDVHLATDVVTGTPILGPAFRATPQSSTPDGTWQLVVPGNSVTAVIGAGCGGSNGVLALGGDVPYLGNEAFSLELRDALPNAACLIAISAAQQTTLLGAGCKAYLGAPFASLFAATANVAGVARVPIAVRQQRTLLGATFYVQAVAVDPQGPLGGLSVSAARQLTVGY